MPKSKEVISDTGSESGSASSEEDAKLKSKSKKPEKKKQESLSEADSESEEDAKSKKRAKKGKDDKGSAKKAKKDTKSENDEDIWELGGNKRIAVRQFKGKLLVDIREMYMDKEGDMKPGKRGISMNIDNWRALLKVIDEVDKCVKAQS